MLPPRRLQTLLNQAIERQKDQCFFHNHNLECSWEDFSLLVDHSCSKCVQFSLFAKFFLFC